MNLWAPHLSFLCVVLNAIMWVIGVPNNLLFVFGSS